MDIEEILKKDMVLTQADLIKIAQKFSKFGERIYGCSPYFRMLEGVSEDEMNEYDKAIREYGDDVMEAIRVIKKLMMVKPFDLHLSAIERSKKKHS